MSFATKNEGVIVVSRQAIYQMHVTASTSYLLMIDDACFVLKKNQLLFLANWNNSPYNQVYSFLRVVFLVLYNLKKNPLLPVDPRVMSIEVWSAVFYRRQHFVNECRQSAFCIADYVGMYSKDIWRYSCIMYSVNVCGFLFLLWNSVPGLPVLIKCNLKLRDVYMK